MAKRGNNRSDIYEQYNELFEKVKIAYRNPDSDQFASTSSFDPDDPDDPVSKKWRKLTEQGKKEQADHNLATHMLLPGQIQRRIKAAIKYEEIARDKLKYNGGMRNFHDFWAFLSTLLPDNSYDFYDIFNNGVMAAAIWILDEISLNDKMDELYPFITDASQEDCNDFFPYSHPSYDTELIFAVINTIRHRNDDLYKPDGYSHNWTDPWTTSSLRDVSIKSKKRENFEGMMALLDENTVMNAKRNYENKVWAFYQLTTKIDEVIQNELKSYDERIISAEKKLQEAYRKQFSDLTGKEIQKAGFPMLSPLMMPDQNTTKNLNKAEIDRLEYEKMRLIREQRELKAKTFADFSTMGRENEREIFAAEWKGIVPDQYIDELVRFSVDDPYETLFALLALLDSNSHIPWLCYGSSAVFYTAMDQLPITKSLYLYDRYPEDKINRGKDPVYQMEYPSEHRLKDMVTAEGEPVVRERAENLAQKLFAQTYTLLPRIRPELPKLDILLKEIGVETEREKEAYRLLVQVLAAGMADSYALESYEDSNSQEDGKEEEQPEKNDNSQEDTKKIAELKHRISVLNKEYRDEAARARKLQDERDEMETEIEDLRHELAELRNIVFNRENDITEEETAEEATITLPYNVKKKTVSFGGHPGWINSMKEYLPDVRFISPDMLPNTLLIRAADVIWIQPNCISHSDYYRIMNVARECDVKVHYYAFDSATKCAKQLAMEEQ